MDIAREQLWEDFDTEEVHIRDKLQFELKSEFSPQPGLPFNQYTQEFYLFIPNSLQINPGTYSKSQFYFDQTNLIRYKTPEFTFEQLFDRNDPRSPLTRVFKLCGSDDTPLHREQLSDELKLLANVVRSALRDEVKGLIALLSATTHTGDFTNFKSRTELLCKNVRQFHESYAEVQQKFLSHWSDQTFYSQLLYIKEFISDVVSHYFAGLLENLRLKTSGNLQAIDDMLCDVLLLEMRANDMLSNGKQGKSGKSNSIEGENYLYRYGLLNKFVLDALYLTINRFTLEQRYQHWIGGLSAGIAMLLYLSLFVWLGTVFVINSAPFVLLTVVTYILKDRIKEWLRSYSYLQASHWFPDYTTIIQTLDQKSDLGLIKESFSLIDPDQLPQQLRDARNAEFNTVLETFQRPENVLFYKRIVSIKTLQRDHEVSRRHNLNIIFRFNIHRFLLKASDPIERHLTLDPLTRKLIDLRLPKVYHLNMIIVSSVMNNGDKARTELKKLRIVVDKNGIKRIEQLSSH